MNYFEWRRRCISYYVSAVAEIAVPIPEDFNLEIYNEIIAHNVTSWPAKPVVLMLEIGCTAKQVGNTLVYALRNLGFDLGISFDGDADSLGVQLVKHDFPIGNIDVTTNIANDAINDLKPEPVEAIITYVAKAGEAYVMKAIIGNIDSTIDTHAALKTIESLKISNVDNTILSDIDLTIDMLDLILSMSAVALGVNGVISIGAHSEMEYLTDIKASDINLEVGFQVALQMVRKMYIIDYSNTYVSQLGYISDTLYI